MPDKPAKRPHTDSSGFSNSRMSPQLAIAATFFAFGLGFGFWAGSSAAVLARLNMGAWLFGVALTAFTGAYLAAMSGAGLIARKFTVKRTLLAALLAIGPALALVMAAPTSEALFAALVVYGFLAGALDATMNAEAARIERGLGRPIFLRLHGGASAGSATGAILGSLLSTGGASLASLFIAEAGMLLAAVLVTRLIAADAGDDLAPPSAVPARLVTRSLVVLGLAIGVSIACESAAMSWSALLLRREAPELAALSGLGAAFFAGCQAALRLNADWLRHHVSDRLLIAVSLGAAAVGFAVVAEGGGFATSVFGFAIVGVGTGAVVPCGFALAATRPGVPAGAAISAVSFFGVFPRLPSPLLTGAVANAFSLSTAFSCLAALLVASAGAVLAFIPANARAPNARVSTVPSAGPPP
jgi:hypothetical protein